MIPATKRWSEHGHLWRRTGSPPPISGPQKEIKPLHLMSWIAPADWDEKVLQGYVDDGEIVSRGPLSDSIDATAPELLTEMQKFVAQMRGAAIFPEQLKVLLAPLILASIRHKSPLPPELWRNAGFPLPAGSEQKR